MNTHTHTTILPILNFATYRFVRLDDIESISDWIRTISIQHAIKGTVLLAHEGINLFVAGREADARAWLLELESDPRFSTLNPKESFSATIPYGKLVCKVRPEIIKMNAPNLVHENEKAPYVDSNTLKRWLDQGVDDEGKPVVMLDTRNQFEVEMGTFNNAISWEIERFTQFPAATDEHAHELEGKTVVSFCTGGIRCEKAAIYLRQAGVNAYQLDGGILRYFEETQGTHYEGNCFVFDDRAIVDTALKQVGNYPPDTQFNPKLYNKG